MRETPCPHHRPDHVSPGAVHARRHPGRCRGYLLKTVDVGELIAAIEAVHRGDYLIDPIIATRVLSELHLACRRNRRASSR